jgi:hypothetical protein
MIEWLILLLHICEVSGSKTEAQRQAILTEIFSWFSSVITGTGYEVKYFNTKSWSAILIKTV